jgi:hypothetical protein
MLNSLLIWGALFAGLLFIVIDNRRATGAVTLAYFLNLSLGHVPGLLAYLHPSMSWGDVEATEIGFDVTLIGMSTFIVGALAARMFPLRSASTDGYKETASTDALTRVGRRLVAVGIVSFFVVSPFSSLVPSLTAIISVLGLLIIVGLWLRLYAVAGDSWRTLMTLAALPALPLLTLVTGGFIGFGISWALSVWVFSFVIAQRRIWFYVATVPIIFLGLSLFVTYFSHRNDIRIVTWDTNTSLIQRLDKVSTLITDFQLLDLSNEGDLDALDQRLNQNYLVGVGVMLHRKGSAELLYGSTVPLWIIIPRALWPNKPPVGGSGDLVSQFTGINFADGTSVGVGQVLEFYMNFGVPGVIAGFAALGFILMRIDQALMRALAMRNIHGAVQNALIGIALLNPLGSLIEVLVAVISAIMASKALVHSKLLSLPPAPKRDAKVSKQPMRMMARR